MEANAGLLGVKQSGRNYKPRPWCQPAMSRASAGSTGPARANQRSTPVRTCCCTGNTDRALLEYVRTALSAGRIISRRTYSEQHTPSFAWQVTSRQALWVLREAQPNLRTCKAARASIALEHYLTVTPRNGKYDAGLQRERHKFEQRFFAVQAAPGLAVKLQCPR